MPREYDPIAIVYDRFWGPRFHDAARPALDRLLYSALRPGVRVLDLCCGSGHLTQELAARRFRVVGIDSSIEMLRCARRRVPPALFVCADADAFALAAGSCDAAVSTFDSINHLTELRRVGAAFGRTALALAPGGQFVFDINTEEAYRSEWGKSSAIVDSDIDVFVSGGYDRESRLGTTTIVMSTPEARKQRRESRITISQRCYEAAEVVPLLVAAGFGDVEVIAASDAGMAGDIAIGRVFIRAIRRSRA